MGRRKGWERQVLQPEGFSRKEGRVERGVPLHPYFKTPTNSGLFFRRTVDMPPLAVTSIVTPFLLFGSHNKWIPLISRGRPGRALLRAVHPFVRVNEEGRGWGGGLQNHGICSEVVLIEDYM